jgi:uncharacterized protein YkwD
MIRRPGLKRLRDKRAVKVTVFLCVLSTIVFLIVTHVGYVPNSQTSGTSPLSAASTVNSSNAVFGGSTGIKTVGNFPIASLLSETNAKRAENAKATLTLSQKLNSSAQSKCEDMVAKDYWSHDAPDGTPPWKFFKAVNYSYSIAGENLAYGFFDTKDVVNGWMNSPTHRENMLNADYKEIGFGVCKSPNYNHSGLQIVVVQHFGVPNTAKPSTQTQSPKPYIAPICTKIPIPYTTKYIDASYLYVGETQSYGGTDGYTNTCTPDSTGYRPPDYTISPYDKTIYVGTKPRPNDTQPPSN